jgi:hypothetical protein
LQSRVVALQLRSSNHTAGMCSAGRLAPSDGWVHMHDHSCYLIIITSGHQCARA